MSILSIHAQDIQLGTANGLYNTGVDANGNPLTQAGAPPNTEDSHYAVTFYPNGNPITTPGGLAVPPASTYVPSAGYYGVASNPTNPSGNAYLVNPVPTPNSPNWVLNSTAAAPYSQWVTYSPTTSLVPPVSTSSPAVTVYQLTLNIPAGKLVTIGGQIAADDGVTIYGNGKELFNDNTNDVSGIHYSSLNPIVAANGLTLTFLSGGTNVLDFVVYNNGGYDTGLDAQLTGFYDPFLFNPSNLTPNQQAVETYIYQILGTGTGNTSFNNLVLALFNLSGTNGFGPALDQLSPEKLDIFSSIAFNNASFMTQNLDDYLAHRRNDEGYFQVNPDFIDASGVTVNDPSVDPKLMQVRSHLQGWTPRNSSDDPKSLVAPSTAPTRPESADRWNAFVQGDVILGQDNGNWDLQHASSTTSSFMAGADYQFTKNVLAGAFLSYSHTDAKLDENGSTATVDSYSPGIYASFAQDGWYANGLASFSHNAYTEQRNININDTFTASANGAPEGNQETVDVDGGYDFHIKQWTFGPTLGFQYVHLNVDGFSESGGSVADLGVNSQTADSFRSRLGGHVMYQTKTEGLILTPFLDASWQHEYLDNVRGITSSFTDVGGEFTVYTPNPGRESALLATGLDIDIDRMTTVYVSYLAQVTPEYYFGQSVLAGVKFAF